MVEREGVVKLLDGERKLKGSFLNIRSLVGCCRSETGMHSIAFAPNYQRSGRFYLYFTNREGNIEIDAFKRRRSSPTRADRGSRRKLLEVRQDQPAHNGGQVAIGPDGLLYAATGDGGTFDDPGNGQGKRNLHGKLLRIDPRRGKRRAYGVPRSNPYVGRRGANEIYARGLRNPWRFSFDRKRILIADVGHERREEVNMERVREARGANFGWNRFEGTRPFRRGRIGRHDKPIHEYGHGGGGCSITGGYVVRDPRLPRLRGRYLYADYCSGEVRSFVPHRRESRKERRVGVPRKPGVVSFGVDGRKRVYLVVMNSGRVYRFDPR